MSDTPDQQQLSSSGPGPDPDHTGGPDGLSDRGQGLPADQGQVPPAPQWTGGRDARTGVPQDPAPPAPQVPGQQYPGGPQQPWQGPGAPVAQPGGAAAFGTQPPQQSRGRRALVTIAGILAFVVAAALVRWGFASFGGPSKQELVDEGVAKISEQTTFPRQVDEITTWTGVEAEDEAIHYRYRVDADPAAVSERTIRDSVLSNLCSTDATRDILEEDIAMRYSYVFTGSDQTVDLEFTNDDC
ncbi:hypothetical protein DEJ16_00660 [Curtobacterium sp. MCJR17_055]|uniref:hypothetical protein n=1 Tax=unclassified Curtobacterium TaxID=257496 RepID=UPI000D8F6D3C|nr:MULTISPECIES: hypothetical protein [unclassified Curtobacterium]PYY34575.1 hypothetical protein DEI87_09240 [Curtobacterium sp. MCBD17_029]PYY57609.1 hypothetical protein DEJ26_11850 [Curtobacterium sp. MCPF17_015]PYY58267.1 hypothetical protein DEJ16_00660 [Curtobacterium sp. MCJR17_055]